MASTAMMLETRLETSSLHSVSTGTGSGSGGVTGAAVDVASSTNGYGFRSTAGDALSIEVAYLNPRRRFPLADEFLPRVKVSTAQARELKVVCEAMISKALANTGLFAWDGSSNHLVGPHAKDWKPHYSKQNLSLYRRKKETAGGDSAALRHFVARGQVHSMNLQDVEYGMYCDTTVDERAVMTDLYRDLFLDAAVLKVYESQTETDPFHFFGIKWLAHVSPADKFVSPRDYAFVEYSKRVINMKGEPFLVKVTHSLSTDNVPAMNQREFDLIRGVISCTYIYRYDAPTKNVQVFADGYLDPSGSAPSWLSKSFLSKFAPTIVSLEHSADVKYIMRHQLVLTFDAFHARVAAQAKQKKHCVMCLKTFSVLTRHYTRCRACAEVVCSRCVLTLPLCIPWHEKRCADHPSAVISEQFCFKCLYTGRLDRNGKYLLEPLATRSHYSGSATSEGGDAVNDLLASKVTTSMTMSASDDEVNSMDDEIVSEQDRVRRLRLRHLEREKRKNMGSSSSHHRTPQKLYHGPERTAAATTPRQQQRDMAAFHEMQHSIAQQEALIRSIQSERAKLAQRPGPSLPPVSRSQYHARMLRNSSSEWRAEPDVGGGYANDSTESRFEEYESSDDDVDALPSSAQYNSHSSKLKPSISRSTRTTMSSTSDSLGSSWDYR